MSVQCLQQPCVSTTRSSSVNHRIRSSYSTARRYSSQDVIEMPSLEIPSYLHTRDGVNPLDLRPIGDDDVKDFMQTPLRKTILNSDDEIMTKNVELVPSIKRTGEVNNVSKKTQKKKTKVSPSERGLVTLGCVLAINSGFQNGLGLSSILGKTQAVSAVTGAFTTSAMAIGSGEGIIKTVVPLSVAFLYMLGSLINGILNPRGMQSDRSTTRFGSTLLCAAGLIVAGNVGSIVFNKNLHLPFLTLAMGMQNSWTSMLINGNVLRTSHFSGITSDIGTVLGQALRGNKENKWKLSIWTKLAASFWTGGLLSIVVTQQVGAAACCWVSPLVYLGLWCTLSVRYDLLPRLSKTKPVLRYKFLRMVYVTRRSLATMNARRRRSNAVTA